MGVLATADLWDKHKNALQIMSPQLRSFGGHTRFSGPVVTVKCFEDNSRVKEAVHEPGDARVLVVDGAGSLRCALLGDQMASAAVQNGWAGVVIFGCIRDSAELATMELGVLALSTCPRSSTRRDQGLRDVEVRFNDVTFAPGSMLHADEDGVVLLPLGS